MSCVFLPVDSLVYLMLLPSCPVMYFFLHVFMYEKSSQNSIYVTVSRRHSRAKRKKLFVCVLHIGWFRNSKWINKKHGMRKENFGSNVPSYVRSLSCPSRKKKQNEKSNNLFPPWRRVSDPIYVVFRSNFNTFPYAQHSRTHTNLFNNFHSPWRQFKSTLCCFVLCFEKKNQKSNASTRKKRNKKKKVKQRAKNNNEREHYENCFQKAPNRKATGT
jgi:hypothetical protein